MTISFSMAESRPSCESSLCALTRAFTSSASTSSREGEEFRRGEPERFFLSLSLSLSLSLREDLWRDDFFLSRERERDLLSMLLERLRERLRLFLREDDFFTSRLLLSRLDERRDEPLARSLDEAFGRSRERERLSLSRPLVPPPDFLRGGERERRRGEERELRLSSCELRFLSRERERRRESIISSRRFSSCIFCSPLSASFAMIFSCAICSAFAAVLFSCAVTAAVRTVGVTDCTGTIGFLAGPHLIGSPPSTVPVRLMAMSACSLLTNCTNAHFERSTRYCASGSSAIRECSTSPHTAVKNWTI
mmetsp:Transcript_27618/g.65772  ORF Transcript_27618/g.65772 Transcript_27618/m.65772 type:complete len:307 (-) Transcript_27618:11-931(-)